jgi:hypothetical protein
MHWQTHTVFNQPTPLNNSNLFCPTARCVKRLSVKALAGMAIFSPALASSWGLPNRWSWDAWPMQST